MFETNIDKYSHRYVGAKVYTCTDLINRAQIVKTCHHFKYNGLTEYLITAN